MEMLMRDFGGEEDLAPRQARSPDGFADPAFAAVFSRRVDVAIAGRQRGRYDLGAILAEAAGAKSDRRNPGAVPG
jgi:hypothetical protein